MKLTIEPYYNLFGQIMKDSFKYSLYLGLVSGTYNVLFYKPRVKLLPEYKYLEDIINVYNYGSIILYTGLIYGLIGITFPISVPTIIYLYKSSIKDK